MSTYKEKYGHEHPLYGNQPSFIESWKQWKELWESCELAEFQHSLLHVGFQVGTLSREERCERVCFYLDVADSQNNDAFNPPWNPEEQQSERHNRGSLDTPLGRVDSGDIRRLIAWKAFTVLCGIFFKDRWEGPWVEFPSWTLLCQPSVFEKVLWFFRVDEKRIANLSYPSEDHRTKTAWLFAYDVCQFAFEFRYFGKYEGEEDIKTQGFLRDAWPRMIPLICALRETNLLLKHHEVLSDECLSTLERLALEETTWVPTQGGITSHYSKVTSVEEACYVGSAAARALILLRTIKNEHQRLMEVAELQAIEWETKQRLVALQR